MNTARKPLYVFLIVAIILAAISPACGFISGKSWAEICGADGSIKRMELPEELLAFLPDDEKQEPEHSAQPDCAFCFSADHIKFMNSENAPLSFALYEHYLRISGGTFAPLGLSIRAYDAQGPPHAFI